ncbi:MAG: phosphoribosylformylglycinamidine cyclo-ligase [Crenarchaeota archaeon]|nr:phosphoribosylformylglycinamidine cyclo-ligase [Thermoproteota archaeon]
MAEPWTYAKAGVDLAKHRQMHEIAHEIIRQLSQRLGIEVSGIERYASSIKLGDHEICLHADGVGTKVIVLQMTGKLWVAGWDALAMNLNDVAVDGFQPVAASMYIALPSSDDEKFRDIMEGAYKAALHGRCLIIGGETAIMPDVVSYPDICCFVIGLRRHVPEAPQPGDVVIGLESNGIHANGLSLARKVLLSKYSADTYIEELGRTIGEELSRETYIYSELILSLYERRLIRCAAHVTGGAFTKLKRVIGKNMNLILDNLPDPPQIFKLIQREGNVPMEEMYRVFNMGIGTVVICPRESSNEIIRVCRDSGYNAQIIGKVTEGNGKVVIRAYTGSEIEY